MAATSRFALYDSNPSICRKFLHYSLSKIPSFTPGRTIFLTSSFAFRRLRLTYVAKSQLPLHNHSKTESYVRSQNHIS